MEHAIDYVALWLVVPNVSKNDQFDILPSYILNICKRWEQKNVIRIINTNIPEKLKKK